MVKGNQMSVEHEKEKLKKLHDKLIDQLVAIDNISQSMFGSMTKEQRLPVMRATKKVRNEVAKLKEAILKI